MSRKYTLKVDFDIRLNKQWMEVWIATRTVMLEYLGFKVRRIIAKPFRVRGYHIWIWILSRKRLSPIKLNMLQMLCGDDLGRTKINMERIKRKIPWNRANKLFSRILWEKKHKCNCDFHQKIIKKIKEGQKAILK